MPDSFAETYRKMVFTESEAKLSTTRDVTPEGVSTIANAPKIFRVGYHPVHTRMKIIVCEGDETNPQPTKETLVCHYDPSDFSETHSVSYEDVGVSGASLQRKQFSYGNPRVWSLKLFFNELGEDVSAGMQLPGVMSVAESLRWLRDVMYPSKTWKGGNIARAIVTTNLQHEKPPILLVLLTNESFLCYMTGLTINRKFLHPRTRAPIRAEVDVEFTEFFPSKI